MHALWIASGIAVWATHFTVIYGLTALACARGYPSAIPWVVATATAAAAMLAIGIFAQGYRNQARFIDWVTAGIALLALVAIVYEAGAALLSPLCD